METGMDVDIKTGATAIAEVHILALTYPGDGNGDAILGALAARLAAAGVTLCGAVQDAPAPRAPDGRKPMMTIRLIGEAGAQIISEDLGPLAQSCRLNAGALEEIAGRLEARLTAIDPAPDLAIVPKFSKREIEGAGFRQAIGIAAARGIPVLTTVKAELAPAFLDFVGDLGAVIDDAEAAFAWGLAVRGAG
jgi:hypothetical protein